MWEHKCLMDSDTEPSLTCWCVTFIPSCLLQALLRLQPQLKAKTSFLQTVKLSHVLCHTWERTTSRPDYSHICSSKSHLSRICEAFPAVRQLAREGILETRRSLSECSTLQTLIFLFIYSYISYSIVFLYKNRRGNWNSQLFLASF